jgi:hypothetical protein
VRVRERNQREISSNKVSFWQNETEAAAQGEVCQKLTFLLHLPWFELIQMLLINIYLQVASIKPL